MEYESPIVFVLGAGFTRAFDTDSPLLYCDINLPHLINKYKEFKGVKKVLEQLEIKNGLINIEKLMSRLYSAMPYDDDFLTEGERQILYADIKDVFIKQIMAIDCEQQKQSILTKFARYVVKNKATCITFNYDDLLDKALFNSHFGNRLDNHFSLDSWTPMRGYGFYIDTARSLTGNGSGTSSRSKTLILKMHGSINWFPKRGYKEPYPMDSIVHMQNWWPIDTTDDGDVFHHYEPSPIIIPPVFDKSMLGGNSIFRLIWSKAFNLLNSAKIVIFIGYSFPDTDFTVINLFKEALYNKPDKNIYIINKGSDINRRELLISRYKTILAQYSDKNFEFMDAFEWLRSNIDN